jgi:hypothetical protein
VALSLTLLPQRLMDKTDEKLLHCYNRLELVRDYDLFQLIGETGRSPLKTMIKPKPVPSNWKVELYGESGLYEVTADAYGDSLTYTIAGQLASLPIPDNTYDWNKSVWAFLRTLPESTIVILWWH